MRQKNSSSSYVQILQLFFLDDFGLRIFCPYNCLKFFLDKILICQGSMCGLLVYWKMHVRVSLHSVQFSEFFNPALRDLRFAATSFLLPISLLWFRCRGGRVIFTPYYRAPLALGNLPNPWLKPWATIIQPLRGWV